MTQFVFLLIPLVKNPQSSIQSIMTGESQHPFIFEDPTLTVHLSQFAQITCHCPSYLAMTQREVIIRFGVENGISAPLM